MKYIGKYIPLLTKKTGYSEESVRGFIRYLQKRMKELDIPTIEDIQQRYSNIHSIQFSERNIFLVCIVGRYHLSTMMTLMNIIESENTFKELFSKLNAELNVISERMQNFSPHSKEYQELLNQQIILLEKQNDLIINYGVQLIDVDTREKFSENSHNVRIRNSENTIRLLKEQFRKDS